MHAREWQNSCNLNLNKMILIYYRVRMIKVRVFLGLASKWRLWQLWQLWQAQCEQPHRVTNRNHGCHKEWAWEQRAKCWICFWKYAENKWWLSMRGNVPTFFFHFVRNINDVVVYSFPCLFLCVTNNNNLVKKREVKERLHSLRRRLSSFDSIRRGHNSPNLD